MCWWPCCHRAIYRVSDSGNLVWKKDWGPRWGTTELPNWVRTVDTDGTYIYAGGTRACFSGDPADVFSVVCYDASGAVVWRSDVGGQVRSIRYVSGLGLLVGHELAHDVSDSVVITRTLGTGNWSLWDEESAFDTYAHTVTAADVQAGLESYPVLTGNVTVSGSSVSAGFTFTFDSSLGGLTGKRPLVRANSVQFTCTSASKCDTTLLDESDGSIIWSANVMSGLSVGGDSFNNTYRVVPFGSNVLAHHITHQTTLYTLTELDSSGGTVSQQVRDDGGDRELDSDGTNYYMWSGSAVRKYGSGHGTTWTSATSGFAARPLFYDSNGYVWGRVGNDAKKLNDSDGSLAQTITSFAFEDIAVMSDQGIAIVAGSTGGANPGVHRYDSGGSFDWSWDDGAVGQCVCAFGDDVIFGSIRQ